MDDVAMRDMRRWISFYQDTVQIVVELKKPQKVKEVAFSSLWRPVNGIWPARAMGVSVSMDGQTFIPVGTKRLTYDFTLTEGTLPGISFICRNGSCICPLGIIEWWLVPERIFS